MTNQMVEKVGIIHHEGIALAKKLKKAALKVLNFVPAAIIIGLIALYYIQLSHVGA